MLLYAVAVGSGFLALLSYRYGLSRTIVLIAFLGLGLLVLGFRLAAAGPHFDDVPEAEPEPGSPVPPGPQAGAKSTR